MAKKCGVCGRSGTFIGGSVCGLCESWVCGIHNPQIITIDPNVAIHIIDKAPGSKQKATVESLMKQSKSTIRLYVCPTCYAWVDNWSKDLFSMQLAAKKKFARNQHMEEALRYERAGRHEDAAKEYELCEAWDDAGRVRREGSTQVIKTINVDLNRLMEDLRRGGLALNYKCHSCGGGITIGSGGVDAPKFCPYCGVMIDTKTLSDMLRTALH
jgi:hypothetical protein